MAHGSTQNIVFGNICEPNVTPEFQKKSKSEAMNFETSVENTFESVLHASGTNITPETFTVQIKEEKDDFKEAENFGTSVVNTFESVLHASGTKITPETFSVQIKEEKDDFKEAENSNYNKFENFKFKESMSQQTNINDRRSDSIGKINSVTGTADFVLYKCGNCSFTHMQLETLSSHVLSCLKRCKEEENHKPLEGERPSKIGLMTQNQTPRCKQEENHKPLEGERPSKIGLMTQNQTPRCKQEENHKPLEEEPPSKIGLLIQNQTPVLSKAVTSVAPKLKVRIVSQNRSSVVTKARTAPRRRQKVQKQKSVAHKHSFSFVSTIKPFVPPQPRVRVANRSPSMVSFKNQVNTDKKVTQITNEAATQLLISSQDQLTGGSKTEFAITNTKNGQPTKVQHVNSQYSLILPKPQSVSVSKQNSQFKKQNDTILMSQTQVKTNPTKEPEIKPSTQHPFTPTSHISSSKTQVVTSSQASFSLASGANTVPIVPPTPLTIVPQGLTIAQTGTQLLLTTKVQQNSGINNQPSLLGLGIGTNPKSPPKNIVLLHNLILNPASSKQISVPIQGQLVLQTAATAPSLKTQGQLQQNLLYKTQSFATQPQILATPLYSVSRNLTDANVVKTINQTKTCSSKTETIVNESKATLPQKLPPRQTSAITSSTSSADVKSSERSSQSFPIRNKYICEICDDYMKDLDKLRNHMQCLHAMTIHPKMVPGFNCQKCQFYFYTEHGLERHLLGTHGLVAAGMQEAADKGKDGGRCPICGWGYQSKLLQHVATDHKVDLQHADVHYKCTLCTTTFGTYKNFEEHIYSVHRPAICKHAKGNMLHSSSEVNEN